MENKKRNEIVLNLACELLQTINYEVDNAFVEDVEGEEDQVLVGITVANPAGLIGFRGRNLAAVQLVLSLMVRNQVGENIKVLLYIKEPDVFAIVAKKTKLHDLSYKERELIRTSKIDKELIKKTNEVIKNNINYFNSIYLKNSIIRRPFLFHLIYYNKYDLIKKILDTLSNEQKEKLVNTKCWYNDSLVSSLDVAKIDTEIYKLLEKYKDLSIYDRYYKIKKITE
jgi:hypothetical protein